MISIIIINYNTFDLTKKCIESVILNTKIKYEIILVDNASIECSCEEFLNVFPEIILVKSEYNCGFSKGNNLGIKASKGEYILLLNSDTIILNNAIDKAFDRLKSDNSLGALSCQLLSVDGGVQNASYIIMPMIKLLGCSLKLHKLFKFFCPPETNLHVEHEAEWIWGTFFFFPRTVLNSFPDNYLTETFFMYTEDAEWCFYIKKAGFKLLYYPEAKILHFGEGSSSKKDDDKWMNRLNNEYYFNRMRRGKWYATLYYFSQSFFYISCFNKDSFKKAFILFSFAFKNVISYRYKELYNEL